MTFEQFLENRQQRINDFLVNILPNPEQSPSHLHEAMHYAVLNGGKRIRPLLVYATGEAFGIHPTVLDYPAGAIELIHAYSLVHDDLPAMDNDDLRRGKPTCHKAFDEATAILVGDALQTLAFSILTKNSEELTPEIRLGMISHLAEATGSMGMAGGQALDLKATGQKINDQELETIHHLKTGALIIACVRLGAIAGNLNIEATQALIHFARYIGLCFQIQDDILNFEGLASITGKNTGTDKNKQKATFTTLNGVNNAKESLRYYYDQAINALDSFGDKVSNLKSLAEYIVIRNH